LPASSLDFGRVWVEQICSKALRGKRPKTGRQRRSGSCLGSQTQAARELTGVVQLPAIRAAFLPASGGLSVSLAIITTHLIKGASEHLF